MVTVNVPVAPCVTWSVAGRRLVSVGPAGVTVMLLPRLLPLSVAVTVAVPGAPAVTGIGAETEPAGTDTESTTDATVGSLLVKVMVVVLDWLALIVAVRVPVLPWVRDRLVGSRLLRVGAGQRLEVAEAVEVRAPPSGPFNVQTRLLPLKGT
jgi:hypothetical protein